MRPQPHSAITDGRLVYVIGPSGAGKDSIIAYARDQIAQAGEAESAPIFQRRFITRPAHEGSEPHFPLTEEEFERRRAAGEFAMAWRSNGLNYGIGREIDGWMATGRHVVVNGSREYLPEASALYSNLVPVLIAIDTAVLRRRLLARGREDPAQIENRLIRATYFQTVRHPALRVIANDGPVEEAGKAFLQLLASLR